MICGPTRWCQLDEDGTLPSQFGHPHQKRTALGQFIQNNDVICNAVIASQKLALYRMYPGQIVYDVALVFPHQGIVNFWMPHDPSSHQKIKVFDILGNVLNEIQYIEDAEMLSGTNKNKAFQMWATQAELDPTLVLSYQLFEEACRMRDKLRQIIPGKLWREMCNAKHITDDELDRIDKPDRLL